jgi:hypothetical protein
MILAFTRHFLFSRQVWVTGTVVDANSSLPLAGVNVTGSRGDITSDARGSYATYATVIDSRVIVTAAAFGNYSSQVGGRGAANDS